MKRASGMYSCRATVRCPTSTTRSSSSRDTMSGDPRGVEVRRHPGQERRVRVAGQPAPRGRGRRRRRCAPATSGPSATCGALGGQRHRDEPAEGRDPAEAVLVRGEEQRASRRARRSRSWSGDSTSRNCTLLRASRRARWPASRARCGPGGRSCVVLREEHLPGPAAQRAGHEADRAPRGRASTRCSSRSQRRGERGRRAGRGRGRRAARRAARSSGVGAERRRRAGRAPRCARCCYSGSQARRRSGSARFEQVFDHEVAWRHGRARDPARLAGPGPPPGSPGLGAHRRGLAARPVPAGVPRLPGCCGATTSCWRGSRCCTSRRARPRCARG